MRILAAAALILLLGLTGVARAVIPDYSLEGQDPAYIKCLEKACGKIEDDEQFEACLGKETYCYGADRWRLEASSVRYDGKTFAVEATVGYAPALHGVFRSEPYGKPVYLGLSVAKADGSIVDVPALELGPGKYPGRFTLKQRTGPGVVAYVLVLWRQKRKPCRDDRPGCKRYGYTLRDQIASVPKMPYPWYAENAEGACLTHFWEHIPGGRGQIEIALMRAGQKDLGDVRSFLREELLPALKPLGRPVLISDAGVAKNPRETFEILIRDPSQEPWARSLAREIGARFYDQSSCSAYDGCPGEACIEGGKTTVWKKAPADVVIVLGKMKKGKK